MINNIEVYNNGKGVQIEMAHPGRGKGKERDVRKFLPEEGSSEQGYKDK